MQNLNRHVNVKRERLYIERFSNVFSCKLLCKSGETQKLGGCLGTQYKARLVACRSLQVKGVTLVETCAPVKMFSPILIILVSFQIDKTTAIYASDICSHCLVYGNVNGELYI